jgi:hypothetical protein
VTDQAFGGDLLAVLFAVLREMAGVRRVAPALFERRIRWPLRLERPIPLALGDRRADRPAPEL